MKNPVTKITRASSLFSLTFMEKIKRIHLQIDMFGIGRKKYSTLSDEDLVLCCKSAVDTLAISELYHRYGHLVMGSCMNIMKQVENAEDITMSIFADLGNKLMKHEVSYFKSWLFQVTRNECLQALRKQRFLFSDQLIELACESEDELSELQEKEIQLDRLTEAISNLKTEQKSCIELFYLKQLSYQTISEDLKLPLNTVKSAIQNGKRTIKIWMERHEK